MNYLDSYTKKQLWDLLEQVPDPEIPVISIVDLGIVRDIVITAEEVTIIITPTYSGCPAMQFIEKEIVNTLNSEGINQVKIEMVYAPAWTTDWINANALKKLKEYGIAPPVRGSEDKGLLFASGPKVVPCPQCNSSNTVLKSQFGSTACKALYTCNDCLEPFDYFKCI